MKRLYLRNLLRAVLHFMLVVVVFYLVYKIRLVTDLIPWVQLEIPPIDFYWTMFFSVLAGLLFLWIWIIKKFYVLNSPVQSHYSIFYKVWIYWFITNTFIIYFGAGFFWEYSPSRFILIFGSVLVFFAILIFDIIWKAYDKKKYKTQNKKSLIISDNSTWYQHMIDNIKEDYFLECDISWLDKLDYEKLGSYYSLFVIGDLGRDNLQQIFDAVRFADTKFYHISEGQFVQDVVYNSAYVANTVAVEYKHSTLDWRSLVFKRIFDIIVWSVALILLSPLFIVLAILIKIDSKWPVFFVQKRVGKWERLFSFIKFRSMYVEMCTGDKYWWNKANKIYEDLINSDQNKRVGILPKIKDDPRVTKMWRFLRKTSMDELPQLFCVLAGTMSLIWPRPHLTREVEQYTSWEKRLLSVKPGITGYAQVFGRDNIPFSQEAKLDLYYIQKWSIFMDFYVLFSTFGVVLKWK